MKRTLKAQREYLKVTNGIFAVYSFLNGKRDFGYSNIGLIDAFETIVRCTAEGKQVIITLASSDNEIMRHEIENNHARASYDFIKQYAVKPDYQGIW